MQPFPIIIFKKIKSSAWENQHVIFFRLCSLNAKKSKSFKLGIYRENWKFLNWNISQKYKYYNFSYSSIQSLIWKKKNAIFFKLYHLTIISTEKKKLYNLLYWFNSFYQILYSFFLTINWIVICSVFKRSKYWNIQVFCFILMKKSNSIFQMTSHETCTLFFDIPFQQLHATAVIRMIGNEIRDFIVRRLKATIVKSLRTQWNAHGTRTFVFSRL